MELTAILVNRVEVLSVNSEPIRKQKQAIHCVVDRNKKEVESNKGTQQLG